MSMLRMLMIPLTATLFSCAVLKAENRPLTAYLDEHATPESAAGRAALAPLALPAGLATLALDAVLVNPLQQLPDALEVGEAPFKIAEDAGALELILFPMRVITAPVLFVGAWIFLCTIPV